MHLRKSFIAMFCALAIAMAGGASLWAQNKQDIVRGVVCEEETFLPVVQAGVLLLSPKDSSMVVGTVTDAEGQFVTAVKPGEYILKIHVLGYQTSYTNLSLTPSQEGTDLGRILLGLESQVLASSTVVAKAAPVVVVADTVVYNAAAYNVAEDASLGDLLNKIPGLEVDGKTVTLNGRTVKKLRVNGKRFFGGDVRTGLDNLTADMVQSLKTYEEESEFTRISGIDDGEREPVIDVTVRKDMMGAWTGNARVGSGPGWRAKGGESAEGGVATWKPEKEATWRARLTANLVKEKDQINVVAGTSRIPLKQSFNSTQSNQIGAGGNGDRKAYEVGVSFSRERKHLDMSGHLQIYGSEKDILSRGQSESVNIASNTFSATRGNTNLLTNVLKSDFVLEWKPDKYRTLYVKPIFNLTFTDTFSNPFSTTFNKDPLGFVADPCDYVRSKIECSVNQSHNRTATYVDREEIGCSTIFTHRSKTKRARSQTYRLELNGTFNGSDQYSDYFVRYLKSKKKPTDSRKLYVVENGELARMKPSFSFSEPLGKKMFLQGTVSVTMTYKHLSRVYRNILPIGSEWSVVNTFKAGEQMAALPENWSMFKDASRCSEGSLFHTAFNTSLSYRYSAKRFTTIVGFSFQPQLMTVRYTTQSEPAGKRNSYSLNYAPTFQLRYNPTKTSKLSLNYNSWSGSPTVNSLLPVINGLNPLYQSTGNPDLKPSFTHSMSFTYNFSQPKKRFSLIMNLDGRIIQDAVSTSYDYDPETGIRTSSPCNIDGNWRAGGNMTINKTFKNDHFSLSNAIATLYTNDVNNLYDSKNKTDVKAVMRRFTIKESFNASYRNKYFELVANLGGEYTDEASTVREDMRQQPFNLRAGATATFSLPWKMRIETEFTTCWQRGYSYDILNRNFYYLNASISQSFLKGKLVLRADGVDLLGQGLNLTRRFATSSRSVTLYNGESRYALLSLVYRFKTKK